MAGWSDRHATERLIASGTVFGLLAGLATGAIAAALAVLFFSDVTDKYGGEQPGTGALVFLFGLLMVAASANCVYSGVAAWTARRARRAPQRSAEMAGENAVTAALEGGRGWAYALFVLYGLAMVAAGALVPVLGDDVGVGDIILALLVAGVGAGLIWFARHSRRHPGWLEED